jgi:phosphatidylserine/phosphatidylglycerophosphate/cardiolipin synthase-like enzyme
MAAPDTDTPTPAPESVNRVIRVTPGQKVTVKFPGDLFRHNDWQMPNPQFPFPYRHGNTVKILIDGPSTFLDMARAVRNTSGVEDFIFLLGWSFVDDFPLDAADPTSTALSLFTSATTRGVQVRVMLWRQIFQDIPGSALPDQQHPEIAELGFTLQARNGPQVSRINSLPQGLDVAGKPIFGANGGAILDGFHQFVASHHQKVLLVRTAQTLFAYCGGIDINADRMQPNVQASSIQNGNPQHDVHCRIEGPATLDLLRVFVQRWRAHPLSPRIDTTKGGLRDFLFNPTIASVPSGGQHTVRVVQTTNPVRAVPGRAPVPIGSGERGCEELLKDAIGRARRFIYVEDQYLVSVDIALTLSKQLPHLAHLTIVIPDGRITKVPQRFVRRGIFLGIIGFGTDKKVRVFCRTGPAPSLPLDQPHSYVHAKTWIFDDEFAIIGSANCNRRGMLHDTEVGVGIFDVSSDPMQKDFARRLRIKLWAEHLNLAPKDLDDGVAAGAFWEPPLPAGATVFPYNNANGKDGPLDLIADWDKYVDPP